MNAHTRKHTDKTYTHIAPAPRYKLTHREKMGRVSQKNWVFEVNWEWRTIGKAEQVGFKGFFLEPIFILSLFYFLFFFLILSMSLPAVDETKSKRCPNCQCCVTTSRTRVERGCRSDCLSVINENAADGLNACRLFVCDTWELVNCRKNHPEQSFRFAIFLLSSFISHYSCPIVNALSCFSGTWLPQARNNKWKRNISNQKRGANS